MAQKARERYGRTTTHERTFFGIAVVIAALLIAWAAATRPDTAVTLDHPAAAVYSADSTSAPAKSTARPPSGPPSCLEALAKSSATTAPVTCRTRSSILRIVDQ